MTSVDDVSAGLKPSLRREPAASTICFKPFSLTEAVTGLVKSGFRNIELSAVKGNVEHLDPDAPTQASIHEINLITDDHGVTIVSISGHSELHTAVGLERHLRLLDVAVAVKAEVLITFIDCATSADWLQYVRNIHVLADSASAAGVGLCIENHNEQMATARLAVDVIADIEHPWVRLNYDTGNAMFLAGVDPVGDVTAAAEVLGHVHLKDQKGGQRNLWFPPLGQGDLDTSRFFSTLNSIGFQGPVSLEIAFNAKWPDWETCLDSAATSYSFWQTLGSPSS